MGKSLLSAPPHFGLKLLVDNAGNIGYESNNSINYFIKGNVIGLRNSAGSTTSHTITAAENSTYNKYLLILIYWSSSGVSSSVNTITSITNGTYRMVMESIKSSQVHRVYEIIPVDKTLNTTVSVNSNGDGYILLGIN